MSVASQGVSYTINHRIEALVQFLECATHQVLWAWEIYPRGAFDEHSCYKTTVWKCRHPSVSNYVHEAIDSIKLLIRHRNIDGIYVRAVKGGSIVDRLYFNTSQFIPPESSIEPIEQGKFDEYFKSILIALQCRLHPLKPKGEYSFEFALKTSKSLSEQEAEEIQGGPLVRQPWILEPSSPNIPSFIDSIEPGGGQVLISYKTGQFAIDILHYGNA